MKRSRSIGACSSHTSESRSCRRLRGWQNEVAFWSDPSALALDTLARFQLIQYQQELVQHLVAGMDSPQEAADSMGISPKSLPTVLEVLNSLVASGGALQADVLSLAANLPPAFQLDAKSELSSVLFDYKYLRNIDLTEQKVAANKQQLDLDKKAKEEFSPLVECALDIFQKIIKFYLEVADFLEDVKAGKFVQTGLEVVVQDPVRQVAFIEMLYCVGSIFLMVDKCLPGTIREKLLVAYFRYNRSSDKALKDRDLIIKLCKRTGYIPGQRHLPQGYPEEYLARFPLEKGADVAVRMALNCLLSRDIYHIMPHYPDPAHRTTALFHQAAYVFVLLFYVPHILQSDAPVMQRIVERFFADRWVLGWAASQVVDLGYEWERYRSAKAALKNSIGPGKNKSQQMYWDRVSRLVVEMGRYLKAGGLHGDTFLQTNSDIFNMIKEANVTLRWILLHSFATSRKVKQVTDYSEGVVKLLLNLSALEYEVRRIYLELLTSRNSKRDRACQIIKDNLKVLSDMYKSPPPGSSLERDAYLALWLKCRSGEVDALGSLSQREASEKLKTLQRAFEDMGQFSRLEIATPGNRKLVQDIRINLILVQQLVNLRQELLDSLRIVGEFSYAYKLLHTDAFVKQLQAVTRKDPQMLWKLGCLLWKMRSVMDVPIFRGRNADRDPPVSVVHYFEGRFTSFSRDVFGHIPSCICHALDEMALIHARKLGQQRGKALEEKTRPSSRSSTLAAVTQNVNLGEDESKKDGKKERAVAYGRLAKLAAKIAQFAKGIAAVEECLKQVTTFPLHQEVERQVRRHLARRLAALAHQKLHFKNSAPPFTFRGAGLKSSQFGSGNRFQGAMKNSSELTTRLLNLKDSLEGYCNALECIQDYLSFPGYGLWQDELAHVISLNLRKECNWMIRMQGIELEASQFDVRDPDKAFTFMGRLCREIIRLTSPTATHFSSCSSSWLDSEGNTVFGVESVRRVRECIGSQGVSSLDTILAGRISHLMDKLHVFCHELDANSLVKAIAEDLQNCKGLDLPGNDAKWYIDVLTQIGKKTWTPLLDIISAIGQTQLIRCQMALELRSRCMLDGPVSLQRSLKGLADHISERYLMQRRQASPTLSATDPPPNQFFFQDNYGDESPPGTPIQKPEIEQIRTRGLDAVGAGPGEQSEADRNGAGLEGVDIAQLRFLPESILPSEDNSTANGSEIRGSSGSTDVMPPSGDTSKKGIDIVGNDIVPQMDGDSDFPDHVLGTISEDGLAARLGLILPTDVSEPSASTGKGGEIIVDGELLRRGHWRSTMPFGSSSRGPGMRTRRKSGGLDAFHRYSEGSSSARTATSLSNSSFWDTTPARLTRFGVTPSEVSSIAGNPLSYASSVFFPRSKYSSFEASFFPPAPSSFDPAESLVSIEPNSPVIHGVGPPGVFSVLQGTGYLDPMEVKYTADDNPPTASVATIFFLTTISILNAYVFHRPSAALMRPVTSSAPDPASFAAGLVSLLFQYKTGVTDEYLRYIGQYIRSYLKTATGSIARGVVAAGVDVSLPEEVRCAVAFVSEICKVGDWARESAEKFIPPCLLDGWVLGAARDGMP